MPASKLRESRALRDREYPEALKQREQKLRGKERLLVGLALSGGGIRSATFCLGVLQALAKVKALSLVDVMSTVSGGGYVGGMLTRCFTRKVEETADDAARPNSQNVESDHTGKPGLAPDAVLRWLRENGRYLAPKRAGDSLLAAVVVLRNWLSVHFVLGALVLGLFLTMQTPRSRMMFLELCLSSWLPYVDHVCWSPWFAFSLPVCLLAVLLALFRWLVGDWPSKSQQSELAHGWSVALKKALMVLFVMLGLAALDTLGGTLYAASRQADFDWAVWFPPWLLAVVSAVLSSPTVAAQLGRPDERRKAGRLPRFGAFSLSVLLYASLLVGLNTFSHAVAWKLNPSDCSLRSPTPTATESLEAISQELAAERQTAPCSAPDCPESPGQGASPGDRMRSRWTLLLAAVLFVFAFVARRPFLNSSSLLPLYTARLARAYLGASNPDRLEALGEEGRVTKPHPNDDIAFSRIPESVWRNTPLHLINVTINETVHGTSGLQHGDRQGVGLSVGPAGLSAGVRHHVVRKCQCECCESCEAAIYPDRCETFRVFDYPLKSDREQYRGEELTLGQWMAISGAAFSTGMGKNTSLGLSLLASFFNIRLGYWWDSGVEPRRRRRILARKSFSWAFRKVFRMHSFFVDEALARFHGTAHRRLWNLSDGGHFENLGAYELLRRRLPLIVVVDSEADPEYRFAGLANLVRKARIDFGAEIKFLSNPELGEYAVASVLPNRACFGSLEMMRKQALEARGGARECTGRQGAGVAGESASGVSPGAHAALARVSYSDSTEDQSLLVYVKAALVGGEPADVGGYKASHPAFPQETTADQFFDEAQWESYRKLGEFVGERVFADGLKGYLDLAGVSSET